MATSAQRSSIDRRLALLAGCENPSAPSQLRQQAEGSSIPSAVESRQVPFHGSVHLALLRPLFLRFVKVHPGNLSPVAPLVQKPNTNKK